jgi:hypothetical protein
MSTFVLTKYLSISTFVLTGLVAHVLLSRRQVGREHSRNFKDLTPSPDFGSRISKRLEFCRERVEKWRSHLPLSSEHGTNKIFKARLWFWLQGDSLTSVQSCSLFARKQIRGRLPMCQALNTDMSSALLFDMSRPLV